MMDVLRVEWLKMKRTPIRWMVFLTPLAFAAAILGYCLLRAPMKDMQAFAFQLTFEAWTAFVVPIAIGVLSGFSIHQEELAGNMNALLGGKRSRAALYLGKFTSLVCMMTLSLVLGVVTVGIGLTLLFDIRVSWSIWLVSTLMTAFATLPLLALHLWASLGWGMGASMGIGGCGVLLAALMATSLGDTVWQFVPWGWPVRLSLLPMAYLSFTPGMAAPPEAISSGFVLGQMTSGIIPAAIVFVIALVGGLLWFQRWEGRKSDE